LGEEREAGKYVVYETTRNGQPWYVLVSGIYASKDEAKRAVTTLPADVQAKIRGQNHCIRFRLI
jgi:DamX protein